MAPARKPGAKEAAKQDDTRAPAETLPSLNLPRGGGAIRGIGETFHADAMTGVGTLTVPVYASPGRSSFDPRLTLTYNSGSGNGPFGFGWNISLPHITRKTDKGLPQYQDAEESGIFILSGAEDLMPALVESGGNWSRDVIPSRSLYGNTYSVHRYRPRVESQFARIERWANIANPQDSFWRAISKDNVTSWYGTSSQTRIADPADPARIFTWLLAVSYDDRGNVICYEYKQEDSTGVDLTQTNERNRTNASRSANQYVKRIYYGNRVPYFPNLAAEAATPLPTDWCFELVFDYGDHDLQNPVPQDTGIPWTCRHDPFSTYRSRFEVRTYRLCRRVLMFHNFPADQNVGAGCLVCSTDLTHAAIPPPNPSQPFYSYLLSVTHSGYTRMGAGYTTDSLPPLEFSYSEANVDATVRQADPDSLRNLPAGIDKQSWRWVDLDGEGVSGILTEQSGAWFYKANLSPANHALISGKRVTLPHFAAVETVGKLPSTAALNAGRQQLMSISGDGHLDLVDFQSATPGYYERTGHESWDPFIPFESLPVTNWNNLELKFIDLTGDGFQDLLIDEGGSFTWYQSLSTLGFAAGQRILPSFDEEKGPRLIFADSTESIFLADMSGDGLTDLVRIRNGEVCYWPNLGYGGFGAKVTMDAAPLFDRSDIFDGRRVRLADLDGSGTTDIVYFAGTNVQLYFNQSGNGFGPSQTLDHFPAFDTLASIDVLDLLGNGTACLVWSSSSPASAGEQLRYIDLMGGQKPHLLIRHANNFGSETLIHYAPSTRFYVADKLAGNPWLTRLPFPIQVVERVETRDAISRNVFVTRCAYHHGYYDGVEREFRGFGRVDQWDAEEYATLMNSTSMPAATNLDASSDVPPILTKTWFHTGAYFGEAAVSAAMQAEYYAEGDAAAGIPGLTPSDVQRMLLPDTVLPTSILLPDGTQLPWTLSPEELREACRALRGSVLRQEIYALDNTGASDRPYSISERNQTVEMLQPQNINPYGTFYSHSRATLDLQYERQLYPLAGNTITNPGPPTPAGWGADPRVTHALTLAVDAYGNVLQSAKIAYGRRYLDPALSAADQAIQSTALATYAITQCTNAIETADAHRTPLAAESTSYELLQLPLNAAPNITNLIGFESLLTVLAGLAAGAYDLAFEDVNPSGLTPGQTYRRLLGQTRTYYRPDDMGASAANSRALLALGTLESLALPGAAYKLAFTSGLITQIYQRSGIALLPTPASVLGSIASDGGGYVDLDSNGNWWTPGSRLYYMTAAPTTPQELTQAQAGFFLPVRLEDPFGNASFVAYDADSLLLTQTTDPVGNIVSSVNDYRVLAPVLITDANLNQTAISFSVLGLVTATAVMGKLGQNFGDQLNGFTVDLAQSQIDAFYNAADPHTLAPPLLGNATTRVIYDIHGFYNSKLASPNDPTKWQPCFAATIARETHVSAPNGGASLLQIGFEYCDGFARVIQKKIQAEPGPVTSGGPTVNPRWIASGWTIYNNKAKPVRQYEPFFSQLATAGQQFEFGVAVGVSPILCYDPPGRVVATILPNQTYEKVVLDPWHRQSWDANDTVLQTNPAADSDVGDFFLRLPASDYTPTWYTQRATSGLGALEQTAAAKAAAHANTPRTAYFDPLGRTFLDVANNGASGLYLTHHALDIQNNQRSITDARGSLAQVNDFTLLQDGIRTASMEAGARWTLQDALGKNIRRWDSRGHNTRTTYDPLRRPLGLYILGTDATNSDPRTLAGELQAETITYGEGQPSDQNLNLRTRIFEQQDAAGIAMNMVTDPATGQPLAFDFKGNLMGSSRRFIANQTQLTDWSKPAPPMAADVFIHLAQYDALNRILNSTTPDSSITTPTWNERSLLKAVSVNLRGAATATQFVTGIEYDAKGQRQQIVYASAGTTTTYSYDPLTFRLIHLTTTRPSFPANQQTVQDLAYTYDPVGNVTHIQDDADLQNTVFFRNVRVEPSTDLTYDPIYRLIESNGREQLGLSATNTPLAPAPTSYNDVPRAGLLQPGDGNAMGIYDETYTYDAVGNLQTLVHHGTDPSNAGWTRTYNYKEASLLNAAQFSNRLSSSVISGNMPLNEPFAYDPHGNMNRMPQLSEIEWDYKDQLLMTQRQAVSSTDTDGAALQGQQTWYNYAASGDRARKGTLSPASVLLKQRFYLGNYEVYREYDASGNTTLEIQSLHVIDGTSRIALVETATIDSSSTAALLPSTTTRYQFSNHLSTACLELDGNANVLTYEEYYPFGSTSYQAGASVAEANLKRYRYNGKERDEESGLYFYGARYYACWLGRWTACDPQGFVDGTNLYSYVNNRPTRLIDPNGTQGSDSVPPPNPSQKNAPPPAVDSTTVTVTDPSGKVVSEKTTPNDPPAGDSASKPDQGPDPNLPSLTVIQNAVGLDPGFRGIESLVWIGPVWGSGLGPSGEKLKFAGPSTGLTNSVRWGLPRFGGGRFGQEAMFAETVSGQSGTSGFGSGASAAGTYHLWSGTSDSFAKFLFYSTLGLNLGQSPEGGFPVSPSATATPGFELGGRDNDTLTLDVNAIFGYNVYSQDATGAQLANQGIFGGGAQLGIKVNDDVQIGPEAYATGYVAGIPGAGAGQPTSATGYTLGAGFFAQSKVRGSSATERSILGGEVLFWYTHDERGSGRTNTYNIGFRFDIGGNRKTK
ncbi:MAG: SpvB/TcaC N-terminal domain-containing protein [Acidobacteriaceae bacterium]